MSSSVFGSWSSPIEAAIAVAAGARRHHPRADGNVLYWLETRPSDGGRTSLIRWTIDDENAPMPSDVSTAGHDVRSRYLEYGSTGYAVGGGWVAWVDAVSGQMWVTGPESRLESADPGGADVDVARPITTSADGAVRWAPLVIEAARGTLLALREDQRDTDLEPVSSLVRIDLHPGGAADQLGTVVIAGRERPAGTRESSSDADEGALAAHDPAREGADFIGDIALSPDGTRMAWVTWDQPAMAWDATTLWVGDLNPAGELTSQRAVAGGPLTGTDLTSGESIEQPLWLDDSTLLFLSDRTGWSNLYRLDVDSADTTIHPLMSEDRDFGQPRWVPDMRSYGLLPDGRVVSARSEDGFRGLVVIDPADGTTQHLETGTAFVVDLAVLATGTVAIQATAADTPSTIWALDPDVDQGHASPVPTGPGAATSSIPSGYAATPEPFWWDTPDGARAHGFLYRPTRPDHQGSGSAESEQPGELPPLIVTLHGGPTACAIPSLTAARTFWTSRGFAVLDVNYGGSTGFGRDYRRRLLGAWGVVDMQDAASGANALAEVGIVDGDRLLITGRSAGGFTTLAAATFTDTFAAGASHFGVSDLGALARDTHKLESRYTDGLVGPYPEAAEVYEARSPLHHIDQISTPLILLQGTEDRVVPPAQAELMAGALREKGLPVALVMFDGEGHGFRDPGAQARALEAELSFYAQVLGFEPGNPIDPVVVENLGRAD